MFHVSTPGAHRARQRRLPVSFNCMLWGERVPRTRQLRMQSSIISSSLIASQTSYWTFPRRLKQSKQFGYSYWCSLVCNSSRFMFPTSPLSGNGPSLSLTSQSAIVLWPIPITPIPFPFAPSSTPACDIVKTQQRPTVGVVVDARAVRCGQWK